MAISNTRRLRPPAQALASGQIPAFVREQAAGGAMAFAQEQAAGCVMISAQAQALGGA